VQTAVEAVPEGKLVDFVTGRIVRDTPEEYVRQNIEKALVHQYGYEPSDCEPEFRIKVGSSRRAVDIAIFVESSEHLQENAYILVETKKAGTSHGDRREGVDQLKSYMAACVNAQYGLWTNGDDRHCFSKRVVRGNTVFQHTPDIPAAGQTEVDLDRPKRRDLRAAAADNLLFAFRRAHNYIAGTEGMQKQEAFWELLKLIFCKIEDERSRDEVRFFATAKELESSTAAASAKARIEELFRERVIRKHPTIFGEGERSISLQANVIAYVVSQLQGFSLLASSIDVKGIAYEEIVGSNLRGDRGEFFTPRNACRMAVQMIDPQPGDLLVDPACGTGGFLIIAMNHVLAMIDQEEKSLWRDPESGTEAERQELYRRRQEYLNSQVFGIDLNPALVRACKMNMVMNNDGAGGLFQGNSLAHPHTWEKELREKIQLNSIDVLFTNPPFGTRIVVDDQDLLSQFDLAAVWDSVEGTRWRTRLDRAGHRVLQKSQPPEILFIERCVQFLKEGSGRLAMVIPNGILNNPALGYVRQWILENTQVLAVIDMHRDLFQPKNDTQTSMVLLRRLSSEERALAREGRLNYPIFMAVAERIGHDKRGNLIYRRNQAGDEVLVNRKERQTEVDPSTGEERLLDVEIRDRVVDDELPEVALAYREWLERNR
jgi:type I restriction enzyme M protein